SIRNLRAKARASVRVELEFGLGSHSFRVERGLNNAELYQDGVVVANSLKEVTGRLQRVLGMTHAEFFNTYFTGQKELAVLADATRPERAAFLSRVLRHEQLTIAQERVREHRNALGHELAELERLHREDAARREEQAKLTELTRNLNVLDRRIEELAEAEPALARAAQDAGALAVKLDSAEKLVEEQQAAWVREKEAAGT